ncbi:hypothetical protein ACQKJC_08870 [Priestia koreensis]|uniref:hypothetical protein n=1 Tax=Priestia koreensis TaxID=284581 RepID=UPI003CFF73E3
MNRILNGEVDEEELIELSKTNEELSSIHKGMLVEFLVSTYGISVDEAREYIGVNNYAE